MEDTNTGRWAFPEKYPRIRENKPAEIVVSPFEYFKITNKEAETAVKNFEMSGGPETATISKIGAQKEVFFVNVGEPQIGYVLKRARLPQLREHLPETAMWHQEQAIKRGFLIFPPSIVINSKDGPYVVSRYVGGNPITEDQYKSLQKMYRFEIDGDLSDNMVKHPLAGYTVRDLESVRFFDKL